MSIEAAIDTADIRRVVSIDDPAIVLDASDIEGYFNIRDESKLVFNGDPVWFCMAPIGHDEFEDIRVHAATGTHMLEEIFAKQCRGWENLVSRGGADSKFKAGESVKFRTQGRHPYERRVHDDVSLEPRMSTRLEMALFVCSISNALPDDVVKNWSALARPSSGAKASESRASDAKTSDETPVATSPT